MRLPLVAAAAATLLAGCERDDVRSYRVAKEAPAPAPEPGSAAPPPRVPADPVPSDPASGQVTWTVPTGWTTSTTQQPMRVATLMKGKSEIAISAFPGDAGGATANVNRWRAQIGLPPSTDDEILKSITTVVAAGVSVSTLKLEGSEQHMLAAIINPGDGNTWFVKSTLKPDEAAALQPAFVTLCGSFRLAGNAGIPAAPEAMAVPAVSGVVARLAAWQAPSTWKQADDPAGIASAMYSVETPAGPVRVTATSLSGDGGGPLANINRWRTQLGLETVAALDNQPQLDIGVPGLIAVDLADAGAKRRMLAAVASDVQSQGAQTWFFKMTGSVESVEAELANFKAMMHAAMNQGAE